MNGHGWEKMNNYMLLLLGLLIGIAAYTDLSEQRIPNWLTAGGTAAGVLACVAARGAQGGAGSAAGIAAGLLLMLALHMIGAVGAGDVKLFGAIGAIAGAGLTVSIAIHSLLFAGVIGVIILGFKRLLRERGAELLTGLIGLVYLQQTEGLTSWGRRKDRLRFPFLLAVVPGTAAALWGTLL
jgi:prepilin peptidase CpaA